MLELKPYDESAAGLVVAWCAESEFSRAWVPAGAEAPAAVVAGWLSDPDITGHLLLRDGVPVAYGELWVEEDEDETELAHLVVDPERRRQGLGCELARRLAEEATARGWGSVTLRVDPRNHRAAACYEGVGFARESEADEERFNAGQPTAYRWMRLLRSAS